MDGSYGITQCSILPNGSFTYNFTLQQSGTYWYHAHYTTTYQDGLFGPLIIHGRNEPNYNISGDFIVMVDDWYHDFSTDLLPAFFAPGNEGAEPVPDNGLINGYKVIETGTNQDKMYLRVRVLHPDIPATIPVQDTPCLQSTPNRDTVSE